MGWCVEKAGAGSRRLVSPNSGPDRQVDRPGGPSSRGSGYSPGSRVARPNNGQGVPPLWKDPPRRPASPFDEIVALLCAGRNKHVESDLRQRLSVFNNQGGYGRTADSWLREVLQGFMGARQQDPNHPLLRQFGMLFQSRRLVAPGEWFELFHAAALMSSERGQVILHPATSAEGARFWPHRDGRAGNLPDALVVSGGDSPLVTLHEMKLVTGKGKGSECLENILRHEGLQRQVGGYAEHVSSGRVSCVVLTLGVSSGAREKANMILRVFSQVFGESKIAHCFASRMIHL